MEDEKLRIGVLAPAWFAVPPAGYGGIEWVVSILADGLADAGHDVTLFASGGSRTRARLVTTYDEPPSLRIGRTLFTFSQPGVIGIGPTLVPGELSATPRFSEQQQRILRALCRPLFGDGEGLTPTSDEEIALSTGIAVETVTIELDHLTRALGLEDMPHPERRAELALLALRSGLVEADEGG